MDSVPTHYLRKSVFGFLFCFMLVLSQKNAEGFIFPIERTILFNDKVMGRYTKHAEIVEIRL